MKIISDATHPPVDVGGNIILPIPYVDRAKADLQNLVGVVLERNDDSLYRIGTKEGIVNKLYCRSEFNVSPLLYRDQVPDQEISLSSAARKAAIGSGQGFSCCACKKAALQSNASARDKEMCVP